MSSKSNRATFKMIICSTFYQMSAQLLICDGHIFDEREFMQHHNHDHYNGGKGPHLFPKSRGKYTGPGC